MLRSDGLCEPYYREIREIHMVGKPIYAVTQDADLGYRAKLFIQGVCDGCGSNDNIFDHKCSHAVANNCCPQGARGITGDDMIQYFAKHFDPTYKIIRIQEGLQEEFCSYAGFVLPEGQFDCSSLTPYAPDSFTY